ncbi:MAG: ubiquinone/menaquinone biosynthesis methyltransferase [Candidatus Dormibacteraeota bacterium]|nr:ubiquinone/menaquinone biosynthesis methyltransferase [Candidatus Dormibacteraeota bacterium]
MSLKPSPLPDAPLKAAAIEAMFDRIAPRYDLVNHVMTLGLDRSWRRRTVRELRLRRGERVVDLACGTGDLCDELQRAGLRPIGVDFAAAMLVRAHTTVPLVRADILQLPFADASLDGVTCGFALRNVTSIDACFQEAARVLRDGGRAAFLEVATPSSPLIRAGHSLYFEHVVPLLGALLSDRRAYRYLPASTAYLPVPVTLMGMLANAGFTGVRRLALGAGAAQLMTATRSR